jgi:tRNA (cmo5U34)-methyltransferase
MSKITDNTQPTGKWTFDGDVTEAFDDMLERSIPQYDVMRKACFDVACTFIKHNTTIVDMGCSRGEAIAMLTDRYGALCRFVGLEVSEPMLAAARERFKGLIACNVVDIRNWDLRNREYPFQNVSLTQSVLTLQFTPIEHRQRIVKNVFNSTMPGGAFILVEKILGSDADLDELMVKTYYAMKAQNGYSQDQIERKRLALEGVLVPVTAQWNEYLLRSAGFTHVDCFWRWMNFAAWVAVKG